METKHDLVAARIWVMRQNGWRRVGVAALAGSLSVLAMAPFFFWPILFVTLPTLVWLLDREDRSLLGAARDGWWFGFGYMFLGLFWIGEAFLVEAEVFAWLLPIAITILPGGLALFFAGAAAMARWFWRPGLSRILILAVSLTAFEWLRGHVLTGLPWNTLGYALTQPIALMQWVSVFGIFGLTLLTVVVCTSPLVLATDAMRAGKSGVALWLGVAIAGVPLVCGYAFGVMQLQMATSAMQENVRLRLVQPAIAQKEKWRPEKREEIFETLLTLSKTHPDGKVDNLAGITHVIWPEAAIPFLVLRTPHALRLIGEMLPDGATLLTGALRFSDAPALANEVTTPAQREAFNSLMVFNSEGLLVGLADKTHLVPFGEFLPMKPVLQAIGLRNLTKQRGGFASGKLPRPLVGVAGLGLVAPLICYEAIFPSEVVQVAERPTVLVNVTNDGWFGDTTGPRQHFHQSRLRAIEQGVPLIRVANGGISAVVDPFGRIQAELRLNKRGTIDSTLPVARAVTIYARFGDSLAAIAALLMLGLSVILGRMKP